jgi:hypothetical protein
MSQPIAGGCLGRDALDLLRSARAGFSTGAPSRLRAGDPAVYCRTHTVGVAGRPHPEGDARWNETRPVEHGRLVRGGGGEPLGAATIAFGGPEDR